MRPPLLVVVVSISAACAFLLAVGLSRVSVFPHNVDTPAVKTGPDSDHPQTFHLQRHLPRPILRLPNDGYPSSRTGGSKPCAVGDICSDTVFKDGFEPPCLPVNDGCGPEEICGNGLDDDCNGFVDDNCTCDTPGEIQPCFNGPPGRRNVGTCTDGTHVCTSEFVWSPCTGGVSPTTEICDGLDNDCNGCLEKNEP